MIIIYFQHHKIEKPFFPLAGDYEIIAWQSQSSQDMSSITITIGVKVLILFKRDIGLKIMLNGSQDQINVWIF